MKYLTATINGKKMVRQWAKKASFETDEEYAEHLRTLNRYPSELDKPDGTVVEEGKDFEFGRNWKEELTAIPLPSKQENRLKEIVGTFPDFPLEKEQENEDELWYEIWRICQKHLKYNAVKYLKEIYTITKKH